MQLPFTTEQFFEVFREYNTTLWPCQCLLFGLALVAAILVDSRVVGLGWAWRPSLQACGHGLASPTTLPSSQRSTHWLTVLRPFRFWAHSDFSGMESFGENLSSG